MDQSVHEGERPEGPRGDRQLCGKCTYEENGIRGRGGAGWRGRQRNRQRRGQEVHDDGGYCEEY
eukprot:12778913-Heterocapsa_arctica.AAC.1